MEEGLNFCTTFSTYKCVTATLQCSCVAVLGTFVGKNSMAAVGSNSPVLGLMINMFIGISVGANVIMFEVYRCTG